MTVVFREIAPGVFVPSDEQPPSARRQARADQLREARDVAERVLDGFGAFETMLLGARRTVRQTLRAAELEAQQHNEQLREVKRCLRRRMK